MNILVESVGRWWWFGLFTLGTLPHMSSSSIPGEAESIPRFSNQCCPHLLLHGRFLFPISTDFHKARLRQCLGTFPQAHFPPSSAGEDWSCTDQVYNGTPHTLPIHYHTRGRTFSDFHPETPASQDLTFPLPILPEALLTHAAMREVSPGWSISSIVSSVG